jgi:hypothetical protein
MKIGEAAKFPASRRQKTLGFLAPCQNMAANRGNTRSQHHVNALQGQTKAEDRNHEKALDEKRYRDQQARGPGPALSAQREVQAAPAGHDGQTEERMRCG